MDVQMIQLDRITTEGVQTRARLRESAVEDYAKLIEEGVELDPALVFQDGVTLYLSAGHHRLAAYRRAGRDRMPCIVEQGTKWDAIQAGMADNQRHKGERLTLEDRRYNVEKSLRERPEYSDRRIASMAGVSPSTVAKFRAKLNGDCPIGQSTERVGRDGRTIDTAAIGQQASSVATDVPAAASTVQTAAEPAKPAEGRVEPLGEASASIERCRCGGQWESSGEGWRFCSSCGRVHPDDPQPEEDDDPLEANVMQPTESVKREASQQSAASLFNEAFRQLGRTKSAVEPLANACPGVHYRRVLDLLDNVGDVLRDWRREAEEEGRVLSA